LGFFANRRAIDVSPKRNIMTGAETPRASFPQAFDLAVVVKGCVCVLQYQARRPLRATVASKAESVLLVRGSHWNEWDVDPGQSSYPAITPGRSSGWIHKARSGLRSVRRHAGRGSFMFWPC